MALTCILSSYTEIMRAARQLLRAASDVAVGKGSSIPAPHYFEPASKSPSPMPHLIIGLAVGAAFAGTYKVRGDIFFCLHCKML